MSFDCTVLKNGDVCLTKEGREVVFIGIDRVDEYIFRMDGIYVRYREQGQRYCGAGREDEAIVGRKPTKVTKQLWLCVVKRPVDRGADCTGYLLFEHEQNPSTYLVHQEQVSVTYEVAQ